MNNGFFIGSSDKYIENVIQKSGELALLAKGDEAEVMLQKIKFKEIVFIEPSKIIETMEFFYIIEGELEIDNKKKKSILKAGDYFYVHHLKEFIQFITLTDVIILYFSSHSQFHFLSETIKELVELNYKLEQKDVYTQNHNERVRNYSVKIGNKLHLSKEKIETIAFAALFHDLGKYYIASEILNKPGKLTEEEFELIKKHPSDGADLVKKTYYENIGETIEQHHERIDGSGYPHGLKDSEIIIEAKIIAVADVYDAMTTDRTYRNAISISDTVNELKSFRGILYDKMVVDCLIDVLKEEGVIK